MNNQGGYGLLAPEQNSKLLLLGAPTYPGLEKYDDGFIAAVIRGYMDAWESNKSIPSTCEIMITSVYEWVTEVVVQQEWEVYKELYYADGIDEEELAEAQDELVQFVLDQEYNVLSDDIEAVLRVLNFTHYDSEWDEGEHRRRLNFAQLELWDFPSIEDTVDEFKSAISSLDKQPDLTKISPSRVDNLRSINRTRIKLGVSPLDHPPHWPFPPDIFYPYEPPYA